GGDLPAAVTQFTLSTPWDITTASFDYLLPLDFPIGWVTGCCMCADGEHFYFLSNPLDAVYSFRIPTGDYAISGAVSLDGDPVEGAFIRAIRQSDGFVSPEVESDSSGNYVVPNLYDDELYHVFIQYEVGGQKYNAPSLWAVAPSAV